MTNNLHQETREEMREYEKLSKHTEISMPNIHTLVFIYLVIE